MPSTNLNMSMRAAISRCLPPISANSLIARALLVNTNPSGLTSRILYDTLFEGDISTGLHSVEKVPPKCLSEIYDIYQSFWSISLPSRQRRNPLILLSEHRLARLNAVSCHLQWLRLPCLQNNHLWCFCLNNGCWSCQRLESIQRARSL